MARIKNRMFSASEVKLYCTQARAHANIATPSYIIIFRTYNLLQKCPKVCLSIIFLRCEYNRYRIQFLYYERLNNELYLHIL